MDNNKIKQYILDFHNRTFNTIDRDVNINTSNKIQTIIGARRVGKTYLFYGKINKLNSLNISKKYMLYLNFESPVLNDISYKEIKDIIELYFSLFPKIITKKFYMFIDEPQTIEKWEFAIREIYDNYNCHIFITGSSSKLLSKEIATSLRGRSISTLLLPLSFKEFLRFKGFNYDINAINTIHKANILNYLDEYILFGGYPEIVLENDKNEKLKILKDYFDLTIYKDIIERYNIKNTNLIKTLMNFLTNCISKEFSLNNFYLTLKSKGIKISKNTLYEYFSMLEDSFFVFPIRKFDYSVKNENLSIPKIYLDDVGFLNLFSIQDYGKRMENMVFLEILRKKHKRPLLNLNYWKSKDGKEIDFVVSEAKKIKELIQVCYDISEPNTKKREFDSIITAMEYFKLNKGIIITKDYENEEKINEKTIEYIPIWKWMLR
ncbi:MAG: ATP-binding protein [Candidatus Woesearchaeota archaeon]